MPDPTTESVTVLGAGIIGICCALSLALRGVPVRLVDRGEPGQATSYGNAGVISPWSIVPMSLPGIWKKIPGMLLNHNHPLSVKAKFWPKMLPWGIQFLIQSREQTVRATSDAMEYLCKPSIQLYRQHLQGTGYQHLIQDSCYVHAFRDASKPNLDAIDYKIRREKGGDLELITAEALRRIEPALSADFQAAVLIKGQAKALSPGLIASILAEKARALGITIVRSNVSGLRRNQSNWELLGTENNITSKRVIISCGIWSRQLMKPLGLNFPLVAERGYHAEFSTPDVEIYNSIMDVDAKLVAASMSNGMRLAGASEFADPDDAPDKSRNALLVKQAKYMFPDLQTDQVSFWMGQRPSLPDSLPVIGPIEGANGLFAAFGHSHYGLMMAPKTGEVLADLLIGKQLDSEIAPYSIKRFC